MKADLNASEMLRRPPPAKISTSKLRSLGRVCGIGHLSEVDDEEVSDV